MPSVKQSRLANKECSVARAMQIVGDRWSILILREAYHGVMRFDEFEYYLDIAPNILSARLKKFVEAGVRTRVPLPEHAGRFEYVLTKRDATSFRPISRGRYGVTTGSRSRQDRRSCSATAPPAVRSNIPPCGLARASRCDWRMSRS
jgi:DNA-binding HxlR family transcriptional regulator